MQTRAAWDGCRFIVARAVDAASHIIKLRTGESFFWLAIAGGQADLANGAYVGVSGFHVQGYKINFFHTPLMVIWGFRLHKEAQCNVRHDEESENRQFIEGHSPIKNGVDRLFRYAEPATMQAI